jgi:outer membrane protein assembly factor BamA
LKNTVFLSVKMKMFFISFFIFHLSSFAQLRHDRTINILLTDTIHQADFLKVKKQLTSQKIFSDSISCSRELQNILLKLNANGYLSASFDSVRFDSLSCRAKLFLGERYEWLSLFKGNVDESFLSGTGFRQKTYERNVFRYDQVRKLQEKILSNCQNNGYPFASVKLDSIQLDDHSVSAKLNLEKNKFIKFDSVVVKGNSTIAGVYIYNYIGIKPGDAYNESLIRKITNRIHELPFVKENRPNQVFFSEHETRLELFLENKKASQFDGVVGLLPDIDNPGKYTLTGEVHLKLQNALAHGEVMELNWKQLPAKSQDLKLHFLYPFLLNTPFGLDASLALYKKDTTYVDVTKNIGVQYQLTGNNYVKAFVNSKESTLESTSGLQFVTVLPDYADVSSIAYGLGFHYEKLDYRLNPRTGFSFETTASTGTRTITKNKDINAELYDSLQLKTNEYHAEITFDYYVPLSSRHVINLGFKGAYQYSPDIFSNELYRFGGLKTLRGFDEESIQASSYGIGKIEYRYLLEQNSYMFAFFNEAYYENKSRNKNIHDTPYGFGSGITFETKLGIMSVSYALGKEFDNPIFFRNGKIHFGILNYF